MKNTNKFFSIFTVTYNAEDKIVDTINSVYYQKFRKYEYILVDGMSTDNTARIIKDYKPDFENIGVEFLCTSEPDEGIYDAMNKCVSQAVGQWGVFLNAGDLLFDTDILEKISDFLEENDDVDVVYGDTVLFKHDGMKKYEKARKLDIIKYDMPFCHQSSIIRMSLLRLHPYDIQYRISADYEFFVWSFVNGARFRYIDKVISWYEYGGISSSESTALEMRGERVEIRRRYKFIDENQYCIELRNIERTRKYKIIVSVIKRIIPDCLLKKRIQRLDKKNGWIKTRKGRKENANSVAL